MRLSICMTWLYTWLMVVNSIFGCLEMDIYTLLSQGPFTKDQATFMDILSVLRVNSNHKAEHIIRSTITGEIIE